MHCPTRVHKKMCSGAFCFIAPPLPPSALVCEKWKAMNTAKNHPHPPQVRSVFHGTAVAMLPPAQLANPSGWVGGLQGKAGRVQCIESAGNGLRPLIFTTESKTQGNSSETTTTTQTHATVLRWCGYPLRGRFGAPKCPFAFALPYTLLSAQIDGL